MRDFRFEGRLNCSGLSRRALPKRVDNGTQLGGKFQESLLVPMNEAAAEELYVATHSRNSGEDPVIMFASSTCQFRDAYCIVEDIEMILAPDDDQYIYEVSWSKFGAFRMVKRERDA